MNTSRLVWLTLIIMTCTACLAACGGGGGIASTMPAVFTLAPTQRPAATAVPKPAVAATATKPATAAPQSTPVPGDASADTADQALQQLDKDLGNVDMVGDVNNSGDVTVTQALDQLDKSLSSTDTLTNVSK